MQNHGRVNMQPVTDKFNGNSEIGCRACNTGGTVQAVVHAVENMRNMGSSGLKCGNCRVVVSRTVAFRNGAAARNAANEFKRTGQFGRNGYEFYPTAACGIKLTKQCCIGRKKIAFGLRPALTAAEKRSLKIYADAFCAGKVMQLLRSALDKFRAYTAERID